MAVAYIDFFDDNDYSLDKSITLTEDRKKLIDPKFEKLKNAFLADFAKSETLQQNFNEIFQFVQLQFPIYYIYNFQKKRLVKMIFCII